MLNHWNIRVQNFIICFARRQTKRYCLHGYDGSHIGRKESAVSLDSGTIAGSKNHQFKSGDRQFKVAIATSKWRSLLQSGDRWFKVANLQFKVAIANLKWRIVSSKWRSRLHSGHREFDSKKRIASSKWRWPVQSSESPVQSGDRLFKAAIASSKWRTASL